MALETNPFAVKLQRLQIPAHMGNEVSVRGHTLRGDADNCIEVPKDIADELSHHGIKAAPEKPAKK
jgi:hypothetical protein